MDLITFLSETKNYFANGFPSSLRVVMGNESCDLDSAVSSIVYAFLLYHINKDGGNEFILPILNINREEYELKTEVTYWFKKHSINKALLTFRDDLDLHQYASEKGFDLYLVDHNILPSVDSVLDPYIASIIDHHPLERTNTPVHGMTVEPVGSCSTLITEAIVKKQPSLLNEQIAFLLYGTIILDTVNLSEVAKRVTPKDVKMLEHLEQVSKYKKDDRSVIFDELTLAKRDISELTANQILQKDLKCLSSRSIKIAISSIPLMVQEFLERSDIERGIESFVNEKDIDIVVMMGIDVSGGDVRRDVAVYGHQKRSLQELCSFLINANSQTLQLEPLATSLCFCRIFNQMNKAASRKVILPLIRQWMDSPK